MGRLPADLVHCDIKPQNLVFFSSEQIWKLIDLATVVEEDADGETEQNGEDQTPNAESEEEAKVEDEGAKVEEEEAAPADAEESTPQAEESAVEASEPPAEAEQE